MSNVLRVRTEPGGEWTEIPSIQGPQGEDGFSPVVTTTPIDGGTKVTITDKEGDHSFNVMNGEGGTADLSNYYNKQEVDDKIAEIELTPGPQGERGTVWFTGIADPNASPDPNATPKTDDLFLNTTNGDVYKYNGTTWVLSGSIRGPQGIQGEKGADGDKGDPGDTYTITAADYDAIADVVLTKIPSAEGVSY